MPPKRTRRAQVDPEMPVLSQNPPETMSERDYQLRIKELELEREKEREQREHEKEMEMLRLEREKIQSQVRLAEINAGNTARQTPSPVVSSDVVTHFNAMVGTFPTNLDETSTFFQNVERAFEIYKIAEPERGTLLLNRLGSKGQMLLMKYSAEELRDYEFIKEKLLSIYRLSATERRKGFFNLRKKDNETYNMFLARLDSSWSFYLKAREVETLQDLNDVILRDRLMELLPEEMQSFILLQAESEKLKALQIADFAQKYAEAHPKKKFVNVERKNQAQYSQNACAKSTEKFQSNTAQKQPNRNSTVKPNFNRPQYSRSGEYQSNDARNKDRDMTCPICKRGGHQKSSCWFRNRSSPASNNTKPKEPSKSGELVARIQATENVLCDRVPPKYEIIYLDNKPIKALVDSGTTICVVNKDIVPKKYIRDFGCVKISPAFGEIRQADLVKIPLAKEAEIHQLAPPNKTELMCALVSELREEMIIHPRHLEKLDDNSQKCNEEESIPEREGINVSVSLPLEQEDALSDISFLWQTTAEESNKNKTRKESLDRCDSTVKDLERESMQKAKSELDKIAFSFMPTETAEIICNTIDEISQTERGRQSDDEALVEEGPSANEQTVFVDPTNESLSNRELFAESQKNCSTLKIAFQHAKEAKYGYFVERSILYHKDKFATGEISQLVLPQERRDEVLQLAHETPFGGHLGSRKTLQRIKLSFFWPMISRDVKAFCTSCKDCQLRRPISYRDRVPISPIVRPDAPFKELMLDVIGPIEPAVRGKRFIICVMDLFSKWPEAYPVTSLSATTTCDVLLEIFSRIGIPNYICSDRGTNFTAQLTQELEARLGVSPKFSSPYHPESQGVIERFNQTFKNMLRHVIDQHPKQWDRYIPYLLWAYREVPNATTGVSPFTLVYGRIPRGPLSLLKEAWINEEDDQDPLKLPKRMAQYLVEVKKKLREVAQLAQESSEKKQLSYTKYYNLRARPKTFEPGEQVIYLQPDSHNKMLSKWIGPVTVLKRRSPSSYEIEMPDSTRRHVHVNKIRKYEERVNALGVIFESDSSFGQVPEVPDKKNFEIQPFQKIELAQLKLEDPNLTPTQKGQLVKTLNKHPVFFSGKIGCVTAVRHKIQLIDGFKRKRVPLYRVPETMKPQVDKQVQELLELKIIERAEVPIAYPVVCIAKKDSTVRLCVDFRSLNIGTEDCAYPMRETTDLLRQIAKAKYISTFDLLKGYWQICMEPESRQYTAFATHKGTYVWNRMPFGLKTASFTFQRAINTALEDCEQFATAYIDDVAVYSESWDSHLLHINKTIKALANFGFTGNITKCQFAKKTVLFLGHLVGSGKILPDPEKLKAIKNLAPPSTKKQLRSALGLFGYYRDHIENFAHIALPLTKLTTKTTPIKIPWGTEQEQAFEELKAKLIAAPALHPPDYEGEFIIDTDASNTGVGMCLAQVSQDGVEHPIAFASHKFTPTELRWSTIEKEAFAVIFALRKFERYIFNARVIVRSDHNPLSYLTRAYPQSPKLQRWAIALQRYSVTIQHRAGKKLINADSLSRLPSSSVQNAKTE